MQAPPAFSMSVSRFGVWRGISLAALTVAVSAAAAWGWSHAGDRPLASLVFLVALPALWHAMRVHQPFHLRWDTQTWHLGVWAGHLSVAIDAGNCMLLRFKPEGRRKSQWLPVQRRGHEAAWHALRCTVYCARRPAEPLAPTLESEGRG